MSHAPPRPVGSVVWVDLSTTDVERSIHFYERVLGWHHTEQRAEPGSYVVASVAAGEVGGMMAMPPADVAAGIPTSWTVCVGVEHLDRLLATARELGGSVLHPPMAIPGDARIAVIADPTGAVLALIEGPVADRGMAWGAPGAATWVECHSRQPAASRAFHEGLLGWKGEEGTGGYVVFRLDGARVGGLMATPANVPVEAPSYWLVYFSVTDVPTVCATAVDLGGTVLEPLHEVDEGRFAVLRDPTGAVFAVFQPTAEAPQ